MKNRPKLEKVKIPNGHVLTMKLSSDFIRELATMYTGEVEITFIPDGDEYNGIIEEKANNQVFGQAKKSEFYNDDEIELPQI